MLALSPGPEINEERIRQVTRLVRKHPGISRAGLSRLLQGRTSSRLASISAAIKGGEIFEGTGYFRARGGRMRSGRGLFPAPASGAGEGLSSADLRAKRDAAGISQTELARRLGLSRVLVNRWERSKEPQPIPAWVVPQIHRAIDEGPAIPHQSRDLVAGAFPRVVAEIERHPGITVTALRRKERAGYGRGVLPALNAALTAEKVHTGPVWLRGRNGSMRCGQGLYPGPPAPSTRSPDPAELKAARDRAHWGQAAIARRLDVSVGLYRQWENNHRPIPAWAAPPLLAALEEARQVEVVDPVAKAVPAVVAVVDAEPGITRKVLVRRRLARFPHSVVDAAVERARASGRLYGHRGLYPGQEPDPLDAENLVAMRTAAGWSLGELARRLGMTASGICAWERGYQVPPHRRDLVRQVLEQAPDAFEARKRALVEVIGRQPGITRQALDRREFDRGRFTTQALAALEEAGRIHHKSTLMTNARGVERTGVGFFVGPAPALASEGELTEGELTGEQLGHARRQAGLSRNEMARRMGVSKTLLGHWEHGKQPVPPVRAAAARKVLAEAPASGPRVDPQIHATSEIEQRLLAVVAAQPGTSGARATDQIPGDIRRRWAALRSLLAAGRIHEEPTTIVDTIGRTRSIVGLFPGAAGR